MPVTELARLRLVPGTDTSSPGLLANLAKAKGVMEQASGFSFHYYHCVEAPDIVFILGAWPSVDFHMQEFIPSQPNQELLALLKDQLIVEWMFHLDIDQTEKALPLDRTFVAIGRHFIKDGDRDHFRETLDDNMHELESHIGGTDQVVGGFRIDQGFDPSSQSDKVEFVLLTGWDSIDRHLEFAKTEAFQKYSQIRKHLDGADIKHAILLEVGEAAQKE